MGMFFNSANCDIYIGKGAGKKLLHEINEARKSIKIVSPYLSPFLIKELIKFSKKNIEIELITTDNIEDFYGGYERNIHKLIIQNREVDKDAVDKREKWNDISKILLISTISLLVISMGVTFFYRDLKLAFALIPIFALFLIYKLFKNKVKNKRIYNYWYSQLFPFKVYMSPDTTELSDTFIHSKIYIIDDKIAYLGSLNFTSSGTKHNYETRIRTEDTNAVMEIKEEFNQLFNHSHLPQKNIQLWGRQLYREPIN